MNGRRNNSEKQRADSTRPFGNFVSVQKLLAVGCCFFCFPSFLLLSAAEIDESKLPPPVTDKIDFARDIKPILENSCLRCHGPEKPKGRFRLDNREAALKGGENGAAILPGNSAHSPLIHFVAYLVEDSEMPPVGKGDQLSTGQVGLLRAWIDQGVVWETGPPTNEFHFSISPIFGGTTVSGDEHKFRELNWQKEGFNGGAEQFELFDRLSPDVKVTASGHALLNDYKIVLAVDKNELGFIHTGWEQYRKYYDDTGGYWPPLTNASSPSLGRDLHLDIGKVWIDFGLTLPRWPQMVFGYEYEYKDGEKSMTSWGNNIPGSVAPNIAPSSKVIHEDVHIIKFDMDHEIYGVTIENRFRGEFYDLNTRYTNTAARSGAFANAREGTSYFQGANTIRLEKKFKDWLYGSGGYLYSKLDADSTFMDTMNNFTLNRTFSNSAPHITLERESHVFNLNGLIGPFDGFSISGGVQTEWTCENGFGGNASLNQVSVRSTASPSPISTRNILATTLSSDTDENSVTEMLALRYNKIPFTGLFAEARLEQQSIGWSADDIQPASTGGNYMDRTSFCSEMSDLRFGFNTSPWRSISFSAHYRRHENESWYDNDQPPQPPGGYPGFIQERDVLTDEFAARLVLHPARWLKTTLSCQFLSTDTWTDTGVATNAGSPLILSPGGNIHSGDDDSQIYSINLTLTPWRRLYLATTFSYQTSTTTTANNDMPAIVPYEGETYSVIANGTYVLNQTTDLLVSYYFAKADYGQNNFADGLPLGIEYQQHSLRVGLTRRFGKHVVTGLRYGYDHYDEPSSGGANDFVAHSVFGIITLKL